MKRRAAKGRSVCPAAAPEFKYRGLWREGYWLVVELDDHCFPNRCVKTNRPVEKPQETVRLYYRPQGYAVKDWLRERREDIYSGLMRLGERNHGKGYYPVDLKLPLSPGWRWFVTWRWAPTFVAVGVYCTIASFVMIVAASVWRGAPGTMWFWLLGISLGIIAFGGSHQIAIAWLFPTKRDDEGHLWLGGVHREWMQPLPVFVPSRRILEQTIFDAQWRLWTSWGVGIFFTGMVIALGIVGATQEAGARPVVLAFLVATTIVLGVGMVASTQIKRARDQIAKHYQLPPKRRRRRGKTKQ